MSGISEAIRAAGDQMRAGLSAAAAAAAESATTERPVSSEQTAAKPLKREGPPSDVSSPVTAAPTSPPPTVVPIKQPPLGPPPKVPKLASVKPPSAPRRLLHRLF
jgi:hypothetical protein